MSLRAEYHIGECLSGMLRPGNAGANTVGDHIVILDEALAQLPAEIAAGHHDGDDPAVVVRDVVIRSDSAGCSEGFLGACRSRNVGFSVVARRNAQVEAAIFDAIGLEECWEPAVRQDGELREGAAVIELTSLVDLSNYPSGTRLIVRREPLHPGAQQSLFPAIDFRYWGHYTDQTGDPVTLDCFMRARARRGAHRATEGFRPLPLPLLLARGEQELALLRHRGGRSRAVVPAPVLRRRARDRAAEDTPVELLPRAGTTRPLGTTRDRPHPRRLAERQSAPRRLRTHRPPHLRAIDSGTSMGRLALPCPCVGQKRQPTRNGERGDSRTSTIGEALPNDCQTMAKRVAREFS